ncbi:MAG: hypothetical protein ACP5I8_06475 [Phycisphaerae bacterium]
MHRLILCEGYDDRSFLAGFLQHHCRCTEPAIADRRPSKYGKGAYIFSAAGGSHEIHVLPCQSVGQVWRSFKSNIGAIASGVHPEIDFLTIFTDHDTVPDGQESVVASNSPPFIKPGSIKELLDGAKIKYREGGSQDIPDWQIDKVDKSQCAVALLHVRTHDLASRPGLPSKQTLERLVCHAIAKAHPDRSNTVTDWLASRQNPPTRTDRQESKEHAYSYLAGWYASDGCDYFFRHIWEQADIREYLIQEMRQTGVLQALESMAR